MVNEKRLIDTFMELVRIDSESGNEAEICKVVSQKFQALGLDVHIDDTKEKTGHGGNLFAEWPASEGLENVAPILFTSHMDTVTPGQRDQAAA